MIQLSKHRCFYSLGVLKQFELFKKSIVLTTTITNTHGAFGPNLLSP